MGKSFWAILAVLIIAVVGIILFAGSDSDTANDVSSSEILSVQESDHKQGPAGASVNLIEYTDFQCPACGAIFPVIQQMLFEFGDQIEFVSRHFPLTSIHPNAMAAHRSAEAASNQGMFWEMHDMLFERQQAWSGSTDVNRIFEGYATELGLDLDQFTTDAASEEVSKVINANVSSGSQVGVQGTPTFFINGELFPTPRSVEEFRAGIQAALDEANGASADTESNQ